MRIALSIINGLIWAVICTVVVYFIDPKYVLFTFLVVAVGFSALTFTAIAICNSAIDIENY